MTSYNYRAMFAIACLGMLVFGIVLTSLGSILPEITDRFGVSKTQAGSLFTLLSFGILIASLVFGPLVDRFGYRIPLATATALVVAGLEAIALGDSLAWLRIGVALIAFGGGIINGGANALVADITTDAKAAGLSLLGVFFGVGAVGVPFLLGALNTRMSYTTLLAIIGAASAIPLVAMAFIGFPAPKQPHSFPLKQTAQLARERPLLLFGAMLFLQSGMEITMGGWSAAFAREALALNAKAALYFLSLYWLGMMSARLLLGSLLRRVAPANAMFVSLATAFTGALLLLNVRGITVAAVGIFLIGAGFAAGFPVILGWIGERYAAMSGTAFSIALVMALSGGMLLPYLTGALANTYGLRGSLLIVPAALLGSASLLIWIRSQRLLNAPTK
jgi:FHS family glucose/mannose:H+ symporter-like MFS transporter